VRRFPSLRQVIALHDEQLAEFGGAPGIRDQGLLESALMRPQSGYYNDVIEEAAALWESLSQNHPFIDGNKRTSLVSMHVFLQMNGYDLTGDGEDLYRFVMELYESQRFKFEELEPWLRANTVKL